MNVRKQCRISDNVARECACTTVAQKCLSIISARPLKSRGTVSYATFATMLSGTVHYHQQERKPNIRLHTSNFTL